MYLTLEEEEEKLIAILSLEGRKKRVKAIAAYVCSASLFAPDIQ